MWQRIVAHQGQTFRQIRGKLFTYRVSGSSLIPSTTHWQIPRGDFEKAHALHPPRNTVPLRRLQGPSYLFAILTDPRIYASEEVPRPPRPAPAPAARPAADPWTDPWTAPSSPPADAHSRPASPATRPAGPAARPALAGDGVVLSLRGCPFRFIRALRPDRDPAGNIREFTPRAEARQAGPLHAHGRGPFCRFRVPDQPAAEGVYAIVQDGVPRYVGRCADLAQRFNMGYGQISPRNCETGGQSTNCKVNTRILLAAKQGVQTDLWFHSTADADRVEAELIRTLAPEWNGGLPAASGSNPW